MKKMYKNPKLEVSEMKPQSIICASITQGDPADGGYGDAPARLDVAPAVPGDGL